ncbi:MAG: kinase [Deltaproteobacteria bacterium]|nr:kinase [Deltaproteobacteria bacterium]
MIISRTPVRLSFFGGGTDYPVFFETFGGAVLGATIDKFVYVSVNRLSEFFDYKVRISYSKAELVNTIDEIVHPSVRETLKYRRVEGNLDIHIFADLPAKTGLGSSSAFTVGFLNALYALDGILAPKQRLAEEAIRIEQEMICENVGCQDQAHAAFGGLNLIEFRKGRLSVRPLVISKAKYDFIDDSLMVFYTGLTRFASDIVKEQVKKTSLRSLDRFLLRMRDMVYEAERIVSDASPDELLRAWGDLLDEGWRLKKQLSGKITTPLVDEIYGKAKAAGAYGGKLSGAGGGGFFFMLVPKERQDAVRAALQGFLEVRFRFESEGSKIIYLTQ